MAEDHETLDGDPAAAFDALRAEVAQLRAALEGLTSTAPDYSPTLADIAESLEAMEEHPALRLTPESFAAQVREASEGARRLAQRELTDTLQQLRRAADDMNGIVEGHRTRQAQNYWLVVMAGAGAVVGVIVWVGFSGPVARALPAGWSVPEKMAAATLKLDRWDAGARLMQSDNPQGWAQVAVGAKLERENRPALEDCWRAAIRTGKAQRCILTLNQGAPKDGNAPKR
jgi:hypothetical protein